MSKSLETLEKIKQTIALKNDGYINLFETLDFLTIETALTLLQDLLGHVTDLYMKKELDYYADREPFYYDYYIVFDNTPLKVSKDLYDEVRKQLDLPNKCVEW